MEPLQKLFLLGESAKYDLCSSIRSSKEERFSHLIYPAMLPQGGCINLFKVLLTNLCEGECFYCVNHCNRPRKLLKFQPEELSRLFMDFYQKGYVQGLFLSSGLGEDSNKTQEEMIKAVEILRFRNRFKGYVHLKILPGARNELVERSIDLADRVSINLEAPSEERLRRISKNKVNYNDLLGKIGFIKKTIERGNLKRDQTTQFVVGAADESDSEILTRVSGLYQEYRLKRVYFSAFEPIPQTPFEEKASVPPMREHRLYQADFLLRDYGFSLWEIPLEENGNLSMEFDPKMKYALNHPELYPVEVNRADYLTLLKVPGIGPRSARRIVDSRKKDPIKNKDCLKASGAVLKRCLPFITMAGKKVEEITEPTPLFRFSGIP